jgi:hypothetical protein
MSSPRQKHPAWLIRECWVQNTLFMSERVRIRLMRDGAITVEGVDAPLAGWADKPSPIPPGLDYLDDDCPHAAYVRGYRDALVRAGLIRPTGENR